MLDTIQFGISCFVCLVLLENVRLKIYKAHILLVVLCGFEIGCVASMDEHRLRVETTGHCGECLHFREMK